jgi:hypothetical protein
MMEEMVELSRESSRKKRGSSSQRPGGMSAQVLKQVKQDHSENF